MRLLQVLRRRQRHQVRVLLLAPELLQEDGRQPGVQDREEQLLGRQVLCPGQKITQLIFYQGVSVLHLVNIFSPSDIHKFYKPISI